MGRCFLAVGPTSVGAATASLPRVHLHLCGNSTQNQHAQKTCQRSTKGHLNCTLTASSIPRWLTQTLAWWIWDQKLCHVCTVRGMKLHCFQVVGLTAIGSATASCPHGSYACQGQLHRAAACTPNLPPLMYHFTGRARRHLSPVGAMEVNRLTCAACAAVCTSLLFACVQAIPRINSQGQLFGAVYKVASEQQLKTEDSGGPAVTVERMQYIEEGAH